MICFFPARKAATPLLYIVTVGILISPGFISAAAEAVPALVGRLVDTTETISPTERERIEAQIRELEETSGGQMAVLLIPSLDQEPIEAFSLRVAETWKIGSAERDDGVILVLAIQDRKNRLEVGYGWEGFINDARAGDILRQMRSDLQREQYERAILGAVWAVQRCTTLDEMPTEDEREEYLQALLDEGDEAGQLQTEESGPFVTLLKWLSGIVFALVVWFLFFRSGSRSNDDDHDNWNNSSSSSDDSDSGGGGGSYGGGGASGSW